MQNDEMMLKGDKKLGIGVVLKRNLLYVKPEIKNFILAFVMIIFNVGLDVILPLFIGEITNLLQPEDGVMVGYYLFWNWINQSNITVL